MNYWLMRSDPADYSIEDLAREGTTLWTGVRDVESRDYMAKKMKVSDRVLLWHTGDAASDGNGRIAGLMRVSAPQRFDPSQFDQSSPVYDAAATRERPIWYCVYVDFLAVAEPMVTRAELIAEPSLAEVEWLKGEPRRDVQPLDPGTFRAIVKLAGMRQRKTS